MSTRLHQAILAASIVALAATGLAGCSGSDEETQPMPKPSNSAWVPAGALEAHQSAADTELAALREKAQATLDSLISPEAFMTEWANDTSYPTFQQAGADLNAFAPAMAARSSASVDDVDITGDDARISGEITLPNFGAEFRARFDAPVDQKKAAGLDTSTLDESQKAKLTAELITELLADPTFPTNSTSVWIFFSKETGTWEESSREAAASALKGLYDFL